MEASLYVKFPFGDTPSFRCYVIVVIHFSRHGDLKAVKERDSPRRVYSVFSPIRLASDCTRFQRVGLAVRHIAQSSRLRYERPHFPRLTESCRVIIYESYDLMATEGRLVGSPPYPSDTQKHAVKRALF